MSAIETMPVLHAEMLQGDIRQKLQQPPREEVGILYCPVCERGFDPRGIAPHMDAHRRAIGDLPPRGKRGPNKSKRAPKLREVIIEPTAAPEPLLVLRQQIKDRLKRIAELEHAAGITEEYGLGEVSRLQAKRHGLGIALELLDGM